MFVCIIFTRVKFLRFLSRVSRQSTSRNRRYHTRKLYHTRWLDCCCVRALLYLRFLLLSGEFVGSPTFQGAARQRSRGPVVRRE